MRDVERREYDTWRIRRQISSDRAEWKGEDARGAGGSDVIRRLPYWPAAEASEMRREMSMTKEVNWDSQWTGKAMYSTDAIYLFYLFIDV